MGLHFCLLKANPERLGVDPRQTASKALSLRGTVPGAPESCFDKAFLQTAQA